MAEVDRDYQTLRYLLSNNLPWGNACQESKRKGISDNGPRPNTLERKGSNTSTHEGGGDEAPTCGTPRNNVTPHADRKPDMVAKHEGRPGEHEKKMQELPGSTPVWTIP